MEFRSGAGAGGRGHKTASAPACCSCLLLLSPATGKMRFVPKFSRSVTSSKRSFHQSETILAQPDPTPRIRPRAASVPRSWRKVNE